MPCALEKVREALGQGVVGTCKVLAKGYVASIPKGRIAVSE